MAVAAVSDEEFISLFTQHGAAQAAKIIGTTERNAFARRRRLEKTLGCQIMTPNATVDHAVDADARLKADAPDGIVVVGSDAHYWPNIVTTAHRAFVKFISEHQPAVVVMNGDVMDGARISRHAPIGWETRPQLIEEIEACHTRLGEIESAIKTKRTRKIWTLGNHDARFETRLATVAPEYAKIHGVHLKDHFPTWEPCWSVWVNDDVVIKHRFKSGIHAPHNNTIWAGKSIVTGHLHSLKVMPISDYNGTRWGVDTGTLADPYGPQFTDYLEDSPRSWRSGFIVLTFVGGKLLWPEICHVVGDGLVDFRGRIHSV